MLKDRSAKQKAKYKPGANSATKMLTMQQAMVYLSEKGVPCRSRATFYRILNDFSIPYVDINPNGRYAVRRFTIEALSRVLEANGIAE